MAKTMGHSGDTTKTGAQTGAPSRDPFAPPPAGAPDRPWQPRGPLMPPSGEHGPGHQGGSGQGSGQGSGAGQSGSRDFVGTSGKAGGPAGAPPGGPTDGPGGGPDGPGADPTAGPTAGPQDAPPTRGRAHVPPPHPWSPGYQGQQPPTPRFPYQQPPGQRFDPTDPVMRRSRYAVLCGIWGVPFMVLGIPYISLLLGALAIYWGISALRGVPKAPNPLAAANGTVPGTVPASQRAPMPADLPTPPTSPYYSPRPQVPAAVVGIVGGVVSLSLVAAVFGVQLYFKNYYDCQANALTKTAYDSCATSVSPRPPVWLTQINGQ